jgi:hypothetical protein
MDLIKFTQSRDKWWALLCDAPIQGTGWNAMAAENRIITAHPVNKLTVHY